MKTKSLHSTKNILWILSVCLILLFLYYTFLQEDTLSNKLFDLEMDGVAILSNIFRTNEINYLRELCKRRNYKEMKTLLLNHKKLKAKCLEQTGSDYIFQDYIWIIQKSAVHTCHRDNNGDFFNVGQKHPSYTLLIYLEPMEKCLGVIPKSHYKKYSYGVNIGDPVIHLSCKPGDMILFNANLIHVGAINPSNHHLRCQMKISHKEDIPVLNFYQNYNKVLNQENNLPTYVTQIQKRVSCMAPIFSDLTQRENVRTVRGSSDNVNISVFQKMFSYLFYGNKDYYDLPNVF